MGSVLGAAGQFISGQYKESAETIVSLILAWKFFFETEVVVGIPEDTNKGREGGISNAGLLYLHEQGVPSHNIPPRPVLKPALGEEETIERIKVLMRDAMEAAVVHGDIDKAKICMEKAGMTGRDACKNYISSGKVTPPNAPSTIAKKGSSKPLIDTGSMLGSISYAVRKKK